MDDFTINFVTTGVLMTMLVVVEKLKKYQRSLNDYILIASFIFWATCITKAYGDEYYQNTFVENVSLESTYADQADQLDFYRVVDIEGFDKECK